MAWGEMGREGLDVMGRDGKGMRRKEQAGVEKWMRQRGEGHTAAGGRQGRRKEGQRRGRQGLVITTTKREKGARREKGTGE